jgi:hypothetical protein
MDNCETMNERYKRGVLFAWLNRFFKVLKDGGRFVYIHSFFLEETDGHDNCGKLIDTNGVTYEILLMKKQNKQTNNGVCVCGGGEI